MILSFIEYFDTKKQNPTYFREKIWAGPGKSSFDCNGTRMICDLKAANAESEFRTGEPIVKLLKPKLHTIREDVHDRWKPGMTIQMVYRGAGYKIIDEFNKGIPELSKCVSTQEIKIDWFDKKKVVELPAEQEYEGEWSDLAGKAAVEGNVILDECCVNYLGKYVRVAIDGFCLDNNSFQKLVRNDGFDSTIDFLTWFKKDFKGKIIHFTDLRY